MAKSGRLRPGVTYVYERDRGVVYARESGSHPHDRFEIGRDFDSEPKILGRPIREVTELVDMAIAAETNPALQEALDHAKMLYELTRDYTEKPGWHPV